MVRFTVFGKPEPQGSTRAFVVKGRPIITSANKNLKSWRQEVSTAARLTCPDNRDFGPLTGPIHINVAFYFERPKSVKAEHKTTRPDVDKLLRGILDALTGIVYADDAQVTGVCASKQFGSPARAEIEILTEDE